MNTYLKIIFILVVASALLWLGIPVRAADRSLTVKRTVHLKKQNSPFLFSSITVLAGGTLIIEPGAVITLMPNASVYVAGKLTAMGTEQEPIRFINNQEQNWDSFIISSEAESAEISHVSFTNFIQPLQFYNRQTLLQDIELIDGESNLIQIGKVGNSYPSLLVKNITIVTKKKASKRLAGVEFKGNFQNIRVQNLTIKEGHAFEDINFRNIHISVEGPHQVMEVLNFLAPYRCDFKVETVPAHDKFFMSPNPSECKPKVLPVVFVPGYGTSINLFLLTKSPSVNPELNGWGFSRLLTSSYFEFFKQLTANGVPYEIAYYDWRLPAKDAFESYVKPVIERTKQKYKVDTVNIAAHSFGGILSRTYIQSDEYEGDVARLIQIGTPNQGAAKSYSVWEAGVLPKDWSFLTSLLRYYAYKFHKNSQPVSLIREFFPSAKELLPIYPAIFRGGEVVSPYDWYHKNTTLLTLRDSIEFLWQRTIVAVVGSNTEKTSEGIDVGANRGRSLLWPDGESKVKEPLLNGFGDGTVPIQSLILSGATIIPTKGTHTELPGEAAEKIINWLYPRISYAKQSASLFQRNGLSFIFDCPIEVEITTPNGEVVSSEKPNTEIGEVFSSDELLWMILPEQLGVYTITIKAKADTPVRWWMENGEIHTFNLVKDQVVTQFSKLDSVSIATQIPGQLPIKNLEIPTTNPDIPQGENPFSEPLLEFFASMPNFSQAAIVDEPEVELITPTQSAVTSLPITKTVNTVPRKKKSVLIVLSILIGIGVILILYKFRK